MKLAQWIKYKTAWVNDEPTDDMFYPDYVSAVALP